MTKLDVLYQDSNFIAVTKPEGLLVHKTNIDKHEKDFLLQSLRDQVGKHLFPIHRLDKPTSGLILFAFSPEAARNIQNQMESNIATKNYLLVCRGFCEEEGLIDHPLKYISDFKKQKNKNALKPPQPAQTAYKRLATIELPISVDKYPTSRYSLVKATLITGRKHQIRRHFKHLSHPIIGCPKYGKSSHNKYFSEAFNAPRLLLHSYEIELNPPGQTNRILITSPISGSFKNVLDTFGWSDIL